MTGAERAPIPAPRSGVMPLAAWRATAVLCGGVTALLAVVFGGSYLARGTVQHVLNQPLFVIWLVPIAGVLLYRALVIIARAGGRPRPAVTAARAWLLGVVVLGVTLVAIITLVNALDLGDTRFAPPLPAVVLGIGSAGMAAWGRRETGRVAAQATALVTLALVILVASAVPLPGPATVVLWLSPLLLTLPILALADQPQRGGQAG